MRTLNVKHPEYGKYGQLEKSSIRELASSKDLPNRVDFHPNIQPSPASPENAVSKKSEEILKTFTVDGQPLTDLYDFKLHKSSFNPHGYGEARPHYYVVGMKKKQAITKTELKEIVKKMIKEVSNYVKVPPGKFQKSNKGFNVVNHTQNEIVVSIEEKHDGINIVVS